MQRLINKKESYWQQHKCGQPHARHGAQHAFLHELSTEIVQQEKDHEKDHCKYHRRTNASFAHDGAQGRPYQEHHHHRQGERVFGMPLHKVHAPVIASYLVFHGRTFERTPGTGHHIGTLLLHQVAGAIGQKMGKGADTGFDGRRLYVHPAAVNISRKGEVGAKVGPAPLAKLAQDLLNGVGTMAQLAYAKHFLPVPESAVGAKAQGKRTQVQHFFIVLEADTKKFVFGCTLVLLLVGPPVLEGQFKEAFIGRNMHQSFSGHGDIILRAGAAFIYDHIVQRGVVGFFGYFDGVTRNGGVENAFLQVEGRFFIHEVCMQGPHFEVGHWDNIIIKKESQNGKQGSCNEQGSHETQQPDAGRFDSDQFEGFAKVAEGHDGGKQHGQGQRQRYQRGAQIHDEARDGEAIDPLANEVIYPQPEKLQDQHEKRKEKSGNEWPDEGSYYQFIEFFDHYCCNDLLLNGSYTFVT